MSKKTAEFLFSPQALQDLEDIRVHTLLNFGEKILDLYDDLIFQSIRDLSLDTKRFGVTCVDEIGSGCRVYHMKYSKSANKSNKQGIKNPRHFILFQQSMNDQFEILSIIHEKRHISFLENRIQNRQI